MIIDAHVHPNPKPQFSVLDSARELHTNFNTQVQHMLLIGLKELKCTNEDLVEVAKDAKLKSYFTLAGSLENFSKDYVRETFDRYFGTKIFQVLKLHPRMQKFSLLEDKVINALKEFSKYKLPVLIDCFHDGHQLLVGDPVRDVASVAEKIPDLKIIMAHSGGYEIFKAMTYAKTFKNLYLDLSYSLLYYCESSLREDYLYAIKSMRGERVLFGTDFPDRPYDISLKMTFDILGSKLSEKFLERFLGLNAAELLDLP